MKRYVVASDLGTGSCKTVVVDDYGYVVGVASCEYLSSYPQPGWCEQDPQDWLKAVGKTVPEALARAGISPTQVSAYGLVGVTHNAVLLDEDGEPLRPCILLYDTRSQVECDQLITRWGDKIYDRTWNSITPIWTFPQLLWVRMNEPEIWRKVKKILFQKDFVRNVIAPSLVTDFIDAEGSLLYDPIHNSWINDFITELDIPVSVLPEVVKSTEIVGRIGTAGAGLTGLLEGTPVIAGTTDTAAEVFGAGALLPGQGTVKLASVGRIACVTTQPVNHPNSLNYRHVLDDLWYPGTATKYASSAFRWLRENVWGNAPYDYMDMAAANISPGSEGLLFHPHLQGEWVPYWDSSLRANFVGITMRHGNDHMARAVMEGVAFALRAGMEYARNLGLAFDEIRLLGGGSESKLWTQIIADSLNRTIIIPAERDAAFGAALITGIGIGMFPSDVDGINRLIRFSEQCVPNPQNCAIYDDLFNIYQESDLVLHEVSKKLADFEKKYPRIKNGG